MLSYVKDSSYSFTPLLKHIVYENVGERKWIKIDNLNKFIVDQEVAEKVWWECSLTPC